MGREAGIAVTGNRLLWESDAQLAKDLDAVAESGATWLRFDVPWSEIEPYRGGTEWARVDRVVDAARARGLKLVGIVTTLSVWARPAGEIWSYGPANDTERGYFAAFAEAAARRYAGRVDVWEVWNEPNMGGGWDPAPSIDDYTALLKRAYPAIKAGNPSALVLSGGTGGGNENGVDVHSDEWVRGLYTRGARSYFDALAVHPYPDPGYASVEHGEMRRALSIRAFMDQNGDAQKKIWGTETGIPTGGFWSVTEARQAQMVEEVFVKWSAMRDHGPLFWYSLVDLEREGREGHFGIIRRDGGRKPAFGTMRALFIAPPAPTPVAPVGGGAIPVSSAPSPPPAGPPPGRLPTLLPMSVGGSGAGPKSAVHVAVPPGAPQTLPAKAWVRSAWRGRTRLTTNGG